MRGHAKARGQTEFQFNLKLGLTPSLSDPIAFEGSTDPENASRAAFTLTEDQYEDLTDHCCGICVQCGYIVDDDDFPLDAEHYKCESCGALEVFEIMKARQLGLIAIKP